LNDFLKQLKVVLIEKPFDYSGRSSRKEYWSYWFFSQFSFITLLIFSLRIKPLIIFVVIYLFILAIPGIAVTVRRLHDVNKSAGWLIGFGPFVFLAYMSLFLLSLISPIDQQSQIDISQIILISTLILGVFAAQLWYCFPIFMFLTQKGDGEENRFGKPN